MNKIEFEPLTGNYWTSEAQFEELLGKTLVDIQGAEEGNDVILFVCSDGTKYAMYHEKDCCESVTIEDICGDAKRLIGTPITKAEEVIRDMHSEEAPLVNDELVDSCTWTFYHLATVKGYVTIRWYGESNGYYSERVNFIHVK